MLHVQKSRKEKQSPRVPPLIRDGSALSTCMWYCHWLSKGISTPCGPRGSEHTRTKAERGGFSPLYPSFYVATEGIVVENGGGDKGTLVPGCSQCTGRHLVWFVVGKRLPWPRYRNDRAIESRNASRSDPPDFVWWWPSALETASPPVRATIRGTGHLCGMVPRDANLPHEAEKDKRKKYQNSTKMPLSDSSWPRSNPLCCIFCHWHPSAKPHTVEFCNRSL
jgi:hypothetical protein